MRTNIVIDDSLMNRAKVATGIGTKRGTIETALRLLLRINNQAKIRNLITKDALADPYELGKRYFGKYDSKNPNLSCDSEKLLKNKFKSG